MGTKEICGNYGKTRTAVREDWKDENGRTPTWNVPRLCKRYMPNCAGNGGCSFLEDEKQ